MRKWKYFNLKDSAKETVGTLYAENKSEAYAIASRMKKLPLDKFRELFGIEKL